MNAIEQKFALVVGATGAIGEQIVRGLITAGYFVFIVSRSKERLDAVAGRVGKDSVKVIPANIANEMDVMELFTEIREHTNQPIPVMVNASGKWIRDSITEMSPEEYIKIGRMLTDMHYTGPMQLMTVGVQDMLEHGGGLFVNFSSHAAKKVLGNNANYSGLKAGILHFAKALSKDAGPTVRITTFMPGLVDTPGNREEFPEVDPAKMISTETIMNHLLELTETEEEVPEIVMTADIVVD